MYTFKIDVADVFGSFACWFYIQHTDSTYDGYVAIAAEARAKAFLGPLADLSTYTVTGTRVDVDSIVATHTHT